MKNIVTILTLSSMIGVVLIVLGFFYPESNIFNGLIVVGLCILLGLAVKMMDQLIDEIKHRSSKILIVPLGIFIPTAMAYLALTEEPVVGMVIGAAIGMLIAGKLDHPMYIFSVALFIALVFVAYLMQIITIETTTFYIIPVAAVGSFLDEFGHDRFNSRKIIKSVFKHRFFLKIFAFLGFALGFAQLVHLIAFICFDIFYDLIDTAWQYDTIRKRSMPHVS
jgi:hypothetical protein